MYKKGLLVLLLSVGFISSASAIDFKIFDMRNKISEESKDIKGLLQKSKDPVFVTSMFDSCLITMTQLDAYFSMLGIFEAARNDEATGESVDFLISWLNVIKDTNSLNIKSLASMSTAKEQQTKVHAEKMKAYFGELNSRIDIELSKVASIKKSLKVKPRK